MRASPIACGSPRCAEAPAVAPMQPAGPCGSPCGSTERVSSRPLPSRRHTLTVLEVVISLSRYIIYCIPMDYATPATRGRCALRSSCCWLHYCYSGSCKRRGEMLSRGRVPSRVAADSDRDRSRSALRAGQQFSAHHRSSVRTSGVGPGCCRATASWLDLNGSYLSTAASSSTLLLAEGA